MYRDEELPRTIAGGQYKLNKRVGQGGMAAVYLADVDLDCFDFALVVAGHESAKGETDEERQAQRQQRYEQWVTRSRAQLVQICDEFNLPYPKDGRAAVKVMIPQEREDAVLRFESEWRQLLAINHPHLIKVFGGGYEDNVPWYSMEVVEQILPIKQIRKLPELAKLDLVYQAAGGLQALHERGIVHRDVKPANLLCCTEGERIRVRVMDLGIAKISTSGEGLTLSHHVMGTPYYMSPEQAGSSKRVDHRADIYSLGAALYSLVTGRRPYDGKSMYEIVGHLVRGEGPEKPLQVNPEMNKDVANLIERMMELDADRRPQNLGIVRDAIKAIFEGDSAEAKKLLAPRVTRRNQPKTRTRAGSSTGGQEGGKLAGVRAGRSKRGAARPAPPARGKMPLPLLAGAFGLIVLLIAAIVYVVGSGPPPPEDLDPFGGTKAAARPAPEQPKKKTAPVEPVKPAPDTVRDAALARINQLGKRTLAQIEQGDLSTFDDALNKLWEAGDTNRAVEPRCAEWKTRLEAARARYCDGLARQAFAAAGAGRRDEARRLLERLALSDATHEKLDELRALVDPPPASRAGQGRIGALLDGKPVALPIRFNALDLKPGDNGQQIVFRSLDAKQGVLAVTVTVDRPGSYLVQLAVRQLGGAPHLHHWVDAPNKQFVCMKVPPAWAVQPREYRLRSVAFHAGANTLDFGFPELAATYHFGPLRITRLFADARPLDRAEFSRLRQARDYQRAHQLMERHAEVQQQPALGRLFERIGGLAGFQGAVQQAQLTTGAAVALSGLSADKAIDLYRAVQTKDTGERAAVEAAYLWEIGDKRALEWAQTALRKGARVADLIEEIKKGVRQ